MIEDEESSLAEIKRIYCSESLEQAREMRLMLMKDEGNDDQVIVSAKDAFFHKKYRFATFNIGMLAFLNQFSGITIILLYSSQIFKDLESKGQFNLSVPIAT